MKPEHFYQGEGGGVFQAGVQSKEAGEMGPRCSHRQEGEPGPSEQAPSGRAEEHPKGTLQALSRSMAAEERARGSQRGRARTWYTVGRIQPLLLQRVQISATSQEA